MLTLYNVVESTVKRMTEANMGRIELKEETLMKLFDEAFKDTGWDLGQGKHDDGTSYYVDHDTRCAYLGFCSGMNWEVRA